MRISGAVAAALLLVWGSGLGEARERSLRPDRGGGSVVTEGSSVRITEIGEVITPPSVIGGPDKGSRRSVLGRDPKQPNSPGGPAPQP